MEPNGHTLTTRLLTSSLLASLAALSACGGGGSDTPAPAPAPAPATPSSVTITGKAVDGALAGATACYDLNDNGACDNGEPTSPATGADGGFTLAVAPADVGKHRIVVQVPGTAVDADTGAAVGTAFTLQAPATGTATAHSVFVSPLTTLVQAHVDATGVSLAEAVSLVQTQAGLAQSPLADFTAATDAASKQAALAARLVQLSTLAQASVLSGVVGQTDLSGGTATAGDVQKQVVAAVIGALPSVVGKLTEPGISGASGSALTAALGAAAKDVVALAGVSADEAKAAIGAAKLPADTSATVPAPSAQLAALRYTDANNWFLRTLQNSAADNTRDAKGLTRYVSVYAQSLGNNYNAGAAYNAWASGGSLARAGDLHWNGSAWVSCKLGDRNTSSVRDAQGRSSYDHCDGLEKGRTVRSFFDLSGQGIANVFTGKIRSYPGGSSGVAYANWGPADLGRFGAAAFPPGAKLFYQTNTPTETALAYDVQASALVTGLPVAVAAGGDARLSPAPACASATSASVKPINTLDDLIAQNPGKPCVFAKLTNGSDASLDPYEQWGTSTASLAVLSGATTRPAGTGSFYNTDLRLRVAFTGGTATAYFSCLTRTSGSSAANCSPIGSGSYRIQTLGDARVMTFSGLPALMQKAGYQRVFVERGGKLSYGYQNTVGAATPYLRLNLEATNAVLAALPGMPAIVPATRYADLAAASQAALTTAKGVWINGDPSGSEFSILRVADGGRYLLGAMGPSDATRREQTGPELGWLDYDATTQTFRVLVETNASMGRGLMLRSAAEQGSEKLTISATQLVSSLGDTLTRLPNNAANLVGLWALGSATEVNTQHFLFLPNGKLLFIDPLGDTEGGICTQQRMGPAGGEWASYTFDAVKGTLHVFGKVYDTNGCAGLFDSTPGAISNGTALAENTVAIQLSGDGNTATISAPDGTFTYYRIAVQ